MNKLEAEQAYLQDEVQKLKNIIQENSLLNLDIARLTADIETVDAQMVYSDIFHAPVISKFFNSLINQSQHFSVKAAFAHNVIDQSMN